jgi:hypothetical protein
MQGIHDLLDGGIVVPPMNVQDIDIGGPEFLEAGVDRNVHAFGIVPYVVDLELNVLVISFERACVLSCSD